MTDFIRSLNYCHFSTVKVDSGNANFFIYANLISSHYISYLNLNPKFASYLNFLQFFIAYPGISNPGPPTGVLGLNLRTKIYELQAYIFEKNPDIIILNETWFKPTILSSEIFPKQYNVFRLDRSPQSHPIDPLNPKRFRKNGGGVLIAVNNDLSLQSKIIPIKCAAELLAVELIFPDSTKIILTTCYRVGTLGTFNSNELLQTLNKLSREKNA